MTKKEQLINKIKGFENRYFNEDQKQIAIDILERAPEKQVQEIADFIFMKRRTGFAFDYSPEIAKGRLITLKEDIDRRINVSDKIDDDENKLIIGDNYNALKTLLLTHKNKIDLIYIDPPYNTESAKEDGNQSEKEGTSSKFVYKDKFGRGGWLNMMKSRLLMAKELLSHDGSIFVSIDDNEQAYLKILMDEIFSEKNFIASIPIEITKTQGMKVASAQNGSVAKNHEYILFYSLKRNPVTNLLYNFVNYYDDHYDMYLDKIEDNKLHFIKITDWIIQNNLERYFKKYDLSLSVKNINKICFYDKKFKDTIYNNSDKIFRISMVGVPSDNVIEQLRKTKGNRKIGYSIGRYILYMNSNDKFEQFQSLAEGLHNSNDFLPTYGRCSIRGTLWKNFYSDMMNVGKEGFVKFKNGKKPIRLIKQLIKWVENDNKITILDFFAGSGTTAHSTMELNNEDNGSRKFIICTNNENNIALDITFERLHKIIKGSGYADSKNIRFPNGMKTFKKEKLRVININDSIKISLKDNIDQKIYSDCVKGIKLLDKNYNKKDLNLYYDLSALNPLENKEDKLL